MQERMLVMRVYYYVEWRSVMPQVNTAPSLPTVVLTINPSVTVTTLQ